MDNENQRLGAKYLTKFYGKPEESVEAWVSDVFKIADMFRWKTNIIARLMFLHLKGTAKDWLMALPQSVIDDPFILSAKLINDFGPVSEAGRMDAMANVRQRPGEPVIEYSSRLLSLTTRYSLEERHVLSFFLNGLDSKIRPLVQLHNPRTIEEARERARLVEGNFNTIQHHKQQKSMHWLSLHRYPPFAAYCASSHRNTGIQELVNSVKDSKEG